MLFVQVGKQHKRKNSQKQPFTDVLQNSCSSKLYLNIVKKATVLASSFNKVAGLKVCIFINKETQTLFSCEYCEMLNNSFFIERPTTLGTKLIFFLFLVSFLCFRHNSIRISVSWLFRTCFHTKIVTLGKCNFRTHRNVGSSTTLVEWLMFRSNPRVTVIFPNNLLWKLWIWVFWILRFVITFP